MELKLPQTQVIDSRATKLVTAFMIVFVLAIIYFLSVKTPLQTKSVDISKPVDINTATVSEAYFVPPTSTNKEVTVRGKVVSAPNEKSSATHKILDGNNNTIVYATTSDDKLRQQEGNVVSLVGNIPFNQEVSPSTILNVQYISIK